MGPEERAKAKIVAYGIIYGLSAWGLANGAGGLGISVGQAQNLIASFLQHFSGVSCSGFCRTLSSLQVTLHDL